MIIREHSCDNGYIVIEWRNNNYNVGCIIGGDGLFCTIEIQIIGIDEI